MQLRSIRQAACAPWLRPPLRLQFTSGPCVRAGGACGVQGPPALIQAMRGREIGRGEGRQRLSGAPMRAWQARQLKVAALDTCTPTLRFTPATGPLAALSSPRPPPTPPPRDPTPPASPFMTDVEFGLPSNLAGGFGECRGPPTPAASAVCRCPAPLGTPGAPRGPGASARAVPGGAAPARALVQWR